MSEEDNEEFELGGLKEFVRLTEEYAETYRKYSQMYKSVEHMQMLMEVALVSPGMKTPLLSIATLSRAGFDFFLNKGCGALTSCIRIDNEEERKVLLAALNQYATDKDMTDLNAIKIAESLATRVASREVR